MKKLDQLTFTRFLAALTVVLFHGGKGLFPFNLFPITPILTSGPISVSYFFVLSGFIMAYVYYRPEKPFAIGRYWWARFARIYPVYLLAFGLTVLYYADIIARIKSLKIWANLLLLQAWIPKWALSFNIAAWSLSVEAFFYLLFPFLAMWAYRQSLRRLITLSLGFWALSQVVHGVLSALLMPKGAYFLYYNPPFHLNSFFLGMVGGIWFLQEGRTRNWGARVVRTLLITSLLTLAALIVLGKALVNAADSPYSISLMNGILSPFFLLVILALALEKGRLARALSHPWLLLLGDASYSLYILHVPVRWLAERAVEITRAGIPYATLYYLYLPTVVLLSVATYLWMERPLRAYLRRQGAQGVLSSPLALFVLDGVVVYASVRLSFALRLGFDAHQMAFYAPAAMLMLWTAWVVRGGAAYLFGLYSRDGVGLVRRVFLAVTGGSFVLGATMSLAGAMGLLMGFPRTTLFLDWGLTLGGALLGRLALARLRERKHGGK